VETSKARDFLIDHHRKIFEAVVSGDARLVDDLMLSHFAIGAALHKQGATRSS
jgi:DNA-binding GntR family transcriptional regulator